MKYYNLLVVVTIFPILMGLSSKAKILGPQNIEKRTLTQSSLKSIRLYPTTNTYDQKTLAPIISIEQNQPLILEFDDLEDRVKNLFVKLIHCNFDWEPSPLFEREYLNDFNEFPITEYDFSFNTRIPYIHYIFKVPNVKVSGNYLLKVYDEDDPEKAILSKRFVIYEKKTETKVEIGVSSDVGKRRVNQQVDFTLNLARIEENNPYDRIKIVIRQNKRWDNALTDLKPTFIHATQQMLEFRPYRLENNFPGGNEFRYFDLRSVDFAGEYVRNIIRKNHTVEAFLGDDKSRNNLAYSQYRDINGDYVVNNADNNDSELGAEYVNVHFFLKSETKLDQTVYILGSFDNWDRGGENQMIFNPQKQQYEGSILLKQGWYNYIYWVEGGNNPLIFEGSHRETENEYEIIVYYRPLGSITDQVVGYQKFSSNPGRN
ncbi:DUF5103 domain-containing protein [Xanthovirga aplysinae]|uniref:type IX secretion system plug protein n=1 Tax=Xanthovirga aplysinae TaxID=2529853 RepID=UPI0012BC89E5|nr:DUF5103 domain-containing protein [Xanthovirga aplysinae]MTI31980.1 DUF5103 domain-containing protein [Xanthovirga aplysinae]